MGARPFEPVFGFDLPHGRCVGVALPVAGEVVDAPLPASALAALPDEERRQAEALPPLRRASWVGGRIALRAALADLPFEAGAILATARGAPRLPDGARGSISHKEELAVALAARVPPAPPGGIGEWHLGVDVERVGAGRADISGYVLRPAERDRLPPLEDPRRDEALRFAFSAKEAVYKALDPFVGRYVSFQEVELERHADGTAAVTLFLRPEAVAAVPAFEGEVSVEVGWRALETGTVAGLAKPFILTTARVTRIR